MIPSGRDDTDTDGLIMPAAVADDEHPFPNHMEPVWRNLLGLVRILVRLVLVLVGRNVRDAMRLVKAFILNIIIVVVLVLLAVLLAADLVVLVYTRDTNKSKAQHSPLYAYKCSKVSRRHFLHTKL